MKNGCGFQGSIITHHIIATLVASQVLLVMLEEYYGYKLNDDKYELDSEEFYSINELSSS